MFLFYFDISVSIKDVLFEFFRFESLNESRWKHGDIFYSKKVSSYNI